MALWRRRVVAAVATDVATSLRRQIHRQMYRLGQSSLPTEGIGPVINLWTREVNDVRDGLIADLDLTPRIHVLAVGLLVIALLVSPLLTTFLASLGLLVWLIGTGLEPRRSTGDARRPSVMLRFSFASCMKIWACCGRCGPTASASTTASGLTNTSIAISRPTRGGL